MKVKLKDCPFCRSSDVDPDAWRNGLGFKGPGCNDCGACARDVETWNAALRADTETSGEFTLVFSENPLLSRGDDSGKELETLGLERAWDALKDAPGHEEHLRSCHVCRDFVEKAAMAAESLEVACERVDWLENTITSYRTGYRKLEGQVKQLQDELQRVYAENARVVKQLHDYRAEHFDEVKRSQTHKEKAADLHNERDNLRNRVRELKGDIDTYGVQIRALRNTRDNLRNAVEDSQEKVRGLEKTNEELKSEVDDLRATNDALTTENDSLRSAYTNAVATCEQLENELNRRWSGVAGRKEGSVNESGEPV